MNFDPVAMRALLALDDAHLWQKIRDIAAGAGIRLGNANPSPDDMARLRTALSGASAADIPAAMATLERYRQGR